MAELIEHLNQLLDTPADTHWFCPRENRDDFAEFYYEEDVGDIEETDQEKKGRLAKIDAANERTHLFFRAVQIFAFDGKDAEPYQEKLRESLGAQLVGCDICVRQYHRGRGDLEHELATQYEASQVQLFMEIFDKLNVDRIVNGLDNVTQDLKELPLEDRRISALSQPALYALLESMHCEPFLRNESLLSEHFDPPFRLVQSRQKISLPGFTVALTSFLFSADDFRSAFALRGWQKSKRNVTAKEFEHSVKPALQAAINRVQITNLERDFMPKFWHGLSLIITKLDQSVITHGLRAMDTDICKLMLDHMQVPSTSFKHLMLCFMMLFEKAPKAVWDAFGSIPSQTIIEQVFNSPNMDQILRLEGDESKTQLSSCLSWIQPFVTSIQSGSLPAACKSLLHQLLGPRTQKPGYNELALSECRRNGLLVLTHALDAAVASGDTGTSSIAAVLDILSEHLPMLMKNISELDEGVRHERTTSLLVVEKALNADITLLAREAAAVIRGSHITLDSGDSATNLWRKAVVAVKSTDTELAQTVLRGCFQFVSLGPLSDRQKKNAEQQSAVWTSKYSERADFITDLLDRISDFQGEQVGLFLEDGAPHIVPLLLCGDKSVHQKAAEALRTLTSESARRDAVRFMLNASYVPTLSALRDTLLSVASAQSFWPSTMILKIGPDFLQALCDSQDGILRTKKLGETENTITKSLWETFWASIATIFESTESWSMMGHDKNMMVEFCRDVMDFAGETFDNYIVFAGALVPGEGAKDTRQEIEQGLLQKPSLAAEKIVKWLRLRDEYLISKAVGLICRLIDRLQEQDLTLPADALVFIDDILSNNVKNKMTQTQKAELRRGLNFQVEEIEHKKQVTPSTVSSKQASLKGWTTAGTGSSAIVAKDAQSKVGGIDFARWSTAAGQSKAVQVDSESDAEKKSVPSATLEKLKVSGQLPVKKPSLPSRTVQPTHVSRNEFLRKRQEALDAKKKRDAEAIAASRRQRDGICMAGSGLSGIGVEGKDHSAKGDNVMVSSDDSESDGDDGGLDDELFGSSGKASKRKNTVKQDAAGVIGLRPEVKPTKVTRLVRSQKDRRARLKPDLSSLHRIILGWDYFHVGDYPPGSDLWRFKAVSNSFRHAVEYKETFEPLLTLEAWQGMVKAREEEQSKPFEVKVSGRSNVDSFVEISTNVTPADLREYQLSEGDIVLLSKASKPTKDEASPHCLSRVHSLKRKARQVEVIYRIMPNTPLSSALTPINAVHAVKIHSIIPLEREYGAIAGLQYYDLCTQIVKANPSPLLEYSDKQLASMISNYSVNKAQAKAIRSAMDNDAFTLIQGPPGSGKTKTIVAIVGALLTDSLEMTHGSTRITVPNAQATEGMAKKLLVCAPSNAAVDELVMRFKDGIKTTKGVHKQINIVRLGRSDAINSAVVDVTLDELISKKLGASSSDNNAKEKTQDLMQEHKKVSQHLNELRQQQDSDTVKGEERSKLQDEINAVRKRKNELGAQIDNAKDAENAAGRNADLKRKQVQQQIINNAHVICATLSGSGHDMFQSLDVEFETVVVDEAAQCVEMSALIPLKYGCVKCVLVGDPKQLPPTVFSKEAAKFQYEQSLFVRMQANAPEAVHLLDTQYRMHPDISAFPSATFYDGRLLDGADMADLRKRPWHRSSLLAPYRFFDVKGQHQAAPVGHSLVNRAEIEIAQLLYERLTRDFRDYDFKGKIGIITPYKSQLRLLKETFAGRYGQSILESIEFNTTDAFQGRESEIIIFSCVRASESGGIGFLQDIRRMNVGLTRAKCSLWVLGNSQSLIRGRFWKQLVDDAQSRDVYTTGDLKSMLRQPSSKFPAKEKAKIDHGGSMDLDTQSASNGVQSKPSATVSPLTSVPPSRDSSADPRIRMEDEGRQVKDENKRAGTELTSKKRLREDDSDDTQKHKAKVGSDSDVDMSDAGSVQKGRHYDKLKPETKTEVKREVKQEVKREIKREIKSEDGASNKPVIKTESKAGVINNGRSTPTSVQNGDTKDNGGSATPPVKKQESHTPANSGTRPLTPSAGVAPPVSAAKAIVKRKPAGSVFMPTKKKKT